MRKKPVEELKMEVKCNVLAVVKNPDPASKVKARVQLLVHSPFQAIEITLFDHNVKNGILGRFETLVGKSSMVPIEINEYKGRIQYGLPFDGMPYAFDERINKSTGEITANDPPLKTVTQGK